jgi:hypothetical protein
VEELLGLFDRSRLDGPTVALNFIYRQVQPCNYLKWSDSSITFDRSDHPEHVPQSGWCLLIVDPIVSMKRLTKVLMDRGSGLNIMYAETLDAMGIDRRASGRLERLSMTSCRGNRPSP